MTESNHSIADVEKIKRWSPVWIIPIVTALIGAWILFYHFSHQGPVVTLYTTTAEGLEAGKTKIKSRSVDVGTVESVTLSDDLNKVLVKARLNAGMNKLLRQDSAFWVVKPQIGREGVTGLGTLLSGAYIELQPGSKGDAGKEEYQLLDAPPLASPDAKGLRIVLDSDKSGQLNAGDPVLFRGYRVGSVETSYFDPKIRAMRYQLFVSAPYDQLVTTNVRFWKDSGVTFDMSAQGMRVEMGSLTTLFSGGVSFDVPQGWERGAKAKEKSVYELYENQRSIQDSLYTVHKDYLMFFSDSVRGLQPGAPVEFRGIRLGTVAQVPFYKEGLEQSLNNDYRIPVLIRIEPDRFQKQLGKDFDMEQHLKDAESRGLRASLKSANLLTGSLYIDLDFYPQQKEWKGPHTMFGYPLLPTTSGGLAQIQQKLMQTLDKINAMPLNPMINEATKTLAESQRTMRETQETMKSLNEIMSSKAMKDLPQDMQKTLQELNRSMKGFQPGSPAYNKMVGDMQRLDQVLRELQPVLRTLNDKSNALVFEAKSSDDPQPKKAKQ
ncbi:intermembrane transport protein PqiB [Serratia sp. JUb9]|uniref:Intermembrane transport protein PqiB n=1 Tax=Serratia rhizosphaerae TaxID=2597702 RepID=A0ABX6GHS0_9GAMM|nr:MULTISPECIES: intermembrane transport protein PqiB [Serratia]MBU3891426.1 intermembrane transport protein PqiB [Serratia rubidaea]AVJ17085.1 paraquat-inducible protein B [Serratia sp. MYb239]MCA4823114.1 intermembrane transport protein PqiB [Serratia rubidaea]QHA85816.1 intermembrane transport protein PqiB [Serratia rhizosphaerae]QNK30997.1 intermembrane transport protein PqiB [Serratia sp. JUb9]